MPKSSPFALVHYEFHNVSRVCVAQLRCTNSSQTARQEQKSTGRGFRNPSSQPFPMIFLSFSDDYHHHEKPFDEFRSRTRVHLASAAFLRWTALFGCFCLANLCYSRSEKWVNMRGENSSRHGPCVPSATAIELLEKDFSVEKTKCSRKLSFTSDEGVLN